MSRVASARSACCEIIATFCGRSGGGGGGGSGGGGDDDGDHDGDGVKMRTKV